ncbi:SGNH/GDSL hydrolase family protein [Flavobacterium suncheonense]|uniref:Membrane protein n=1 Tax=Flavobacterium suncheonense GH29-5 = DSM 17707 TaxID=1121899 RepID=A0A0A2MFB5_9FLAO|nr:membrane protein [Flavobacterium suncheonense]KGO90276.1 membrane protein [Flavobacterium suncheonense GH29-5 = DSM 17707]
MNQNKSYFLQSFAIFALSIVAFLVFKSFLPKKIFAETTANSKNVVIDSLLLEAVEEDSTAEEGDTLSNQPISFTAVDGITFPDETFSDYKGFQHLVQFYEKLYQLETTQQGNVRIAYFGDSMTDGDMIVQDFRTNFQNQFGGQGVGFVNITSESAASRNSIKHEFSGNWKTQSYLNVKNPRSPFGVNGHVFFANDTAHVEWVKYQASKLKNLSELYNPTLFYGKSANKSGKIALKVGNDTICKKLTPNKLVNTLVIGNTTKNLKVDFVKADSIPIYGFNFDDGKGVHVDNFSNRGNSGLPISTFNTEVMRQFQEKLGYDLIVLHYGTNVLNYGSLNYTWYEKRMKNVVNHLKECFPGVAILVISTADKATKYDLEMKTDSAVVPLTLAQKKYAVQAEAAYVNLYTLMGGDGSMVKWVEEVPAAANKDYTHFNYRGAKRISSMIYNQIYSGYEQFKKLRANRKVVKAAVKKDSTTVKKDSIHVD